MKTTYKLFTPKTSSTALLTHSLLLGSLIASPATSAFAKAMPHGTQPETRLNAQKDQVGDGDNDEQIELTEMPAWVIPYFNNIESRISHLKK